MRVEARDPGNLRLLCFQVSFCLQKPPALPCFSCHGLNRTSAPFSFSHDGCHHMLEMSLLLSEEVAQPQGDGVAFPPHTSVTQAESETRPSSSTPGLLPQSQGFESHPSASISNYISFGVPGKQWSPQRAGGVGRLGAGIRSIGGQRPWGGFWGGKVKVCAPRKLENNSRMLASFPSLNAEGTWNRHGDRPPLKEYGSQSVHIRANKNRGVHKSCQLL